MAWEVHTKGGPNASSFEICVIRSTNVHGKDSYGWFGERKVLISQSGGACHNSVTPAVWSKLVQVAYEVANEMNASSAEG